MFGWLADGSVCDRLAGQELEREADAGAADGGRVGDGDALEARVAGRVKELGDERAEVGADDRHERLAGGLDGVNDLRVHARRPDALGVVVLAAGQPFVDQRRGGRRVPAGVDAVDGREHLDARVFGERLLEADVAVVVGRVAGEAAHVVDVARAAHLLEQPLGAEVRVVDLVVVQVVGVRVGDVRVDRDGQDAGGIAPPRGPG